MLCGLGIYPRLTLSSCNHTHEVYREDRNVGISRGSGALEILKERYVRGEITKEQFLEMRQIIEQ